jgi:hypothetical protein
MWMYSGDELRAIFGVARASRILTNRISKGEGELQVYESNTMATAGGIVGIVGYALAWIPALGIPIGLVMGVLAIILGAVGLGRTQYVGTGRGMATTGLVLGILTVIWKLIPGLNLI